MFPILKLDKYMGYVLT